MTNDTNNEKKPISISIPDLPPSRRTPSRRPRSATHATVRRARSHSPSRRSPKLQHTNGRLDQQESEPVDVTTTLLLPLIAWLHQENQPTRLYARSLPTPSAFPRRTDVRRSISCCADGTVSPTASSPTDSSSTRRLKIFYRDEALRENCARNTRYMLASAIEPTTDDATDQTQSQTKTTPKQRMLAMKALKYRKLLDRMQQIDKACLKDPSFDVSSCLGIEWCKV